MPLASSSPPSSALTPSAFHAAYSLPATAASGTPTIAIVDAYDDPNVEADLAVFDQQFGLPPCTTDNGCFRKVDQNGGTNYPSGTSWHLEIALDVQVAHAICQNCKILLVEASSASIAALGTAVNTAVALGANVVSNSYGAAEFSGETAYDAYYEHPGVAITASSGEYDLQVRTHQHRQELRLLLLPASEPGGNVRAPADGEQRVHADRHRRARHRNVIAART